MSISINNLLWLGILILKKCYCLGQSRSDHVHIFKLSIIYTIVSINIQKNADKIKIFMSINAAGEI